MAALSESFALLANGNALGESKQKPPANHMRLHLLYLIHDVFHHARYHDQAAQSLKNVFIDLRPCISTLVKAFAATKSENGIIVKIWDVLTLWQRQQYLDDAGLQDLFDTIEGKATSDELGPSQPYTNEQDEKRNAPFVMPNLHGDPSTPFYDLPASNMMPHIIPNSSRPIDPQLVQPLQLRPGPAEKQLADALKSFLVDVEMLDHVGANGGVQIDVDDLGQIMDVDRNARTALGGDGYYGWSRRFCDGMKKGELVDDIVRSDSATAGYADDFNERNPWSRRSSADVSVGSRDSSRPSLSRRASARFRSLRSQSRSYSPPSPSNYRSSEAPKSPSAVPQQEGLRARSPPVDPRRDPLTRHLESHPSLNRVEAQRSFAAKNSHSPERPLVPPKPPNYRGPWPPPPPPID